MIPRFLPLLLSMACAGPASTEDTSGPGGDSADPEICGPQASFGLALGQCAPDFTMPDRADQPFTLSSLRGKVALVDISAVW